MSVECESLDHKHSFDCGTYPDTCPDYDEFDGCPAAPGEVFPKSVDSLALASMTIKGMRVYLQEINDRLSTVFSELDELEELVAGLAPRANPTEPPDR